ncbi:hypothetical protein CPB84DRAFT_1709090 [Gymnopilus junonius]|uniref:Uncharacterized protein n=1 Tax=Gymnopilus junonius TaxID=109634 RepID=A0A9P5TN87_GYMJU|nr:hypothetical protein CPB84DRAFT_1709090 [Gymnopilus junonius]
MSPDEKRVPVDISGSELEAAADNVKTQLISSRDFSPVPSDDLFVSDPPEDPRFIRPSPFPLKRLALVIFLAYLFWHGFQVCPPLLEGKKDSKVIYASRYSKDHLFRPAASPVVTETLRNGRIRIRGALPTPTDSPMPLKKKASTGKVGGKKRGHKSKTKRAAGGEKGM